MPFTLLRCSVALVLGASAAWLLVAPGALPASVIALAAAELVAAALFAVPRTVRIGGVALIGVLGAATVLHVTARQAPPISFVVDVAAIWVVLSARPRGAGAAR